MKALTEYRIILADGASYNEKRNVREMLKSFGLFVPVFTDKEPVHAPELVFGKTNRAASQSLYSTLPCGGYAIVSEDDSIYVAYDNYLVATEAIARIGELFRSDEELPLNILEIPDHSALHMQKENDEQIRVMTTNIVAAGDVSALKYLAEKYDVTYVDRIDLQASVILDYLPDFIGLQELQEGTVNKINGLMHTEIAKYISDEYTLVNLDEFVPVKKHQWTPIAYRHTKWELLEFRAARNEEILNVMHRWQWGVYRNKENGQLFIHMNLHGPHSGNEQFRDFQPIFFGRVNEQVKALLEKYPNTPMAITGDYNQLYDTPSMQELKKNTTLDTAYLVAKDTTYPEHYGIIDHIMINTDVQTADTYRMIEDGLIYMTSDHRPCFVDLTVKK